MKQLNKLRNGLLGFILIMGVSAMALNGFPHSKESKTEPTHALRFLANPEHYTLKCVCDEPGMITDAAMTHHGDLRIDYAYHCNGKDHSGRLMGSYDPATRHFDGTYNTNNGMFKGEINLSFDLNGEANGTWDHGFAKVVIRLKK